MPNAQTGSPRGPVSPSTSLNINLHVLPKSPTTPDDQGDLTPTPTTAEETSSSLQTAQQANPSNKPRVRPRNLPRDPMTIRTFSTADAFDAMNLSEEQRKWLLENCDWLSGTDDPASWDYGVQLLLLYWVNNRGLDMEWAKELDPVPKLERLRRMQKEGPGGEGVN